jgi:hypothetical protein
MLKRIWIILLFLGAHTALWALMTVDVVNCRDSERGMLWWPFLYIDFPVSMIFFPDDWGRTAEMSLCVLLLGGLQWLIIGWFVQSLANNWQALLNS